MKERLRNATAASTILKIVALLLVGAGVLLLTAAPRANVPSAAEVARERARFEALGALQGAPGFATQEQQAILIDPPTAGSPPPTRTTFLASARLKLEAGITGADIAATPAGTPEPPADMPPATHITIPAVGIDTDIVEVLPKTETIEGQLIESWQVADWAAGHHSGSADPGENGNIVLAGHDDVRGEVFRGLHNIAPGDEVLLSTADGVHRYVVEEIQVRLERGAPLEERLATGQYIAPMPEERLTMITCWPYGIDDHRLIIIAKPHA